MFMGGLLVAMVLENATGRSTHNSVISKSVKDGLENNASAIQAEFANLREEISKLSFHLNSEVSARMAQNVNIQSVLARLQRQDNILQSSIDSINAKPSFAAEIRPSSGYDYLPWGDITGYTELVDVGNNFDPKTGRLTIKDEQQNGAYIFRVSGFKNGSRGQEAVIEVLKNNDFIQQIFEEDEKHSLMVNSVFTLHLQKGDEVKLRHNNDESIYVNSYNPFTFTGHKI